jgi:hypothetical protein
MVHKMYSIYDTASKMFRPPFALPEHMVAMRAFKELANNPEHDISKYSDDHYLYYIGVFNDENGEMVAEVPPVKLAWAEELKDEKATDFITPNIQPVENKKANGKDEPSKNQTVK